MGFSAGLTSDRSMENHISSSHDEEEEENRKALRGWLERDYLVPIGRVG